MVPTPKKDPGVCVLDVVTPPALSVAVGSVQVTVVPPLPVVVVAVTSLMQLTVGATLSTDEIMTFGKGFSSFVAFLSVVVDRHWEKGQGGEGQ